VNLIGDYGVTVDPDSYIHIEQTVGKFLFNHIASTIASVMKPSAKTDAAAKIEKLDQFGWRYLHKPVWSMLTPRIVAHRTEPVDFAIDEHVTTCYTAVCNGFLLADFGLKELALLVSEIPRLAPDKTTLLMQITAAKKFSRNIFYLHGVARRSFETRVNILKETISKLQHHTTDVATSSEPLDYVEARVLANRWKDMEHDLDIRGALNDV
jgi:hypothetical protein